VNPGLVWGLTLILNQVFAFAGGKEPSLSKMKNPFPKQQQLFAGL